MKFLLAVLVVLVVPFVQAAAPEAKPSAQRSRVVLLQPVILADDDGSNEANAVFPKKLVDRCYTRADLEFLYLEPKIWRNTKARRGEINLDQVCKEAESAGLLRGQGEIVNLIFVSAIDGKAVTCGRGRMNGNVCFVCLPEKNNDPGMLEFVVAHEVGHCFGLIHAVDDPLVPDDVPNVQGDGPYAERLGVDGINDHQRDIVLKSPLVQQRVKFLSAEESAKRMLDESWEPYISSLPPSAVRAFLSRKDVPEDAAQAQEMAREWFPKEVLDFTAAEKRMLRQGIASLAKNPALREWGMLHRAPWHFIKVKGGFCGGFPHTRGTATVFSAPTLAGMMRNEAWRDVLLAHEKLHVLQRFFPERFCRRFAEPAGFTAVPGLELPKALFPAYLPNPDAMSTWFRFSEGGSEWVALTLLADLQNPVMGRDFRNMAYPLIRQRGKPTLDVDGGRPFPDEFPMIAKRLAGVPGGTEHPNEVAGYLSHLFVAPDDGVKVDPALGKALEAFLETPELWK